MTPENNFDSHQCSNNHLHGIPARHPGSYMWSSSRQCISVELGMFLPSARRAERKVRRDDDECDALRSTSIAGISVIREFCPLAETCPNFLEGLH